MIFCFVMHCGFCSSRWRGGLGVAEVGCWCTSQLSCGERRSYTLDKSNDHSRWTLQRVFRLMGEAGEPGGKPADTRENRRTEISAFLLSSHNFWKWILKPEMDQTKTDGGSEKTNKKETSLTEGEADGVVGWQSVCSPLGRQSWKDKKQKTRGGKARCDDANLMRKEPAIDDLILIKAVK